MGHLGSWLGCVSLAAAVAGCAASAPSVKSTMQVIPPTSAVLVGKFGVLNRHPMGAFFYELHAVNLDDGKKWNIPLSADDVGPDGNSVPFFVELPPGHYQLTSWSIQTSRRVYGGKDAGALISLRPGQAVCIGAVYIGRTSGTLRIPLGSSATYEFRSGMVVREECDALNVLLKQRAPLLPPAETHLAIDATSLVPRAK